MSANTPGPWSIGSRKYGAIHGQGDVPVATAYLAASRSSDEEKAARDAMEANARLIAAAPALLDALIEAVGMLEEYQLYAEEMRKEGRGFYPTSRSGCTPEYLVSSIKADIARSR